MNKRILLAAALVVCAAFPARGETWGSFASLVDTSDFIGQYQHLERGGEVVGRRLVATYWKSPDFDVKAVGGAARGWTLSDYRRETDTLVTLFVFHGRGQHLWTASPEKGVILYPGATAHRQLGAEVACSATEFHDLLTRAGQMKRAGEETEGRLALPVFGEGEAVGRGR